MTGIVSYDKRKEGKRVKCLVKNFGWDIFYLKKKKILNPCKKKTLSEENKFLFQEETYFLGSVGFYKEETIMDNKFLKRCYDIFLRSWDKEKVTLVNSQWFYF